MKHITIGILAHVDAGKTTLSEAFLYSCGVVRKLGRVDHRDAFLDTFSMERERGITIFSKQAELTFPNNVRVTLLDTPGHVDFSAEMERTLQVLDYAILVISGADGVQSHTRTLWKLLQRYEIPVFLFVNKMDQEGTDAERLYEALKKELDGNCVVFSWGSDEGVGADSLEKSMRAEGQLDGLPDVVLESIATCGEQLLEEYLSDGTISKTSIQKAIAGRMVFPCYYGSALKLNGVEELIQGIAEYAVPYGTYADNIESIEMISDTAHSGIMKMDRNMDTDTHGKTSAMVKDRGSDVFGALVYKIARDSKGTRLTHMKITSGSLKVKELLHHMEGESEKVDQIRIYSGDSYTQVQEVRAGEICAVTGLEHSYCGEGYGAAKDSQTPILEPVLMYQLNLPEDADVHKVWNQLQELEEENPLLRMTWMEASGEIQVQVMGEVELDILKAIIQERYDLEVSFGQGSLVYKETIRSVVEGIGHYEPLRHYAEVHVLMEPGEPGTGIQIESTCSEDVLSRNWQRLIMTHIAERQHPGVLTGSELTDVRITLLTGRAHTKHTEGGDFRQATYRAIRQGLMQAESVLLEPVYEYRLELPRECSGRAIADMRRMSGDFEGPEFEGELAIVKGIAPVATMIGYQREVQEYTHGLGRLYCDLHGYQPCHNSEEVVAQYGYDPESDVENPASSVFCAHGAGFIVPWDEVENYMHLERSYNEDASDSVEEPDVTAVVGRKRHQASQTGSGSSMSIGEDEIREIFERTYGAGSMDRKFYNRNSWEDYDSVIGDSGDGSSRDGVDYHGRSYQNPGRQNVSDKGDPKYEKHRRQPPKKDAYLLVDGYNIIFAWEELKSLADTDLGAARGRLMDIMCNYQGYRGVNLIVVFDAYKVSGNPGTAFDYHNIHIVYTKEAQTADQYIEKFVHETGRTYDITVATSDGLEQLIVMGAGARRLSARNLLEEVELMERELRERYLKL